jgi:diamine N-acetyltransferase
MTPADVRLAEITDENRDAVCALRVSPGQERFVASVVDSLAEAARTPEGEPWYRAIYAAGEPVGFLMLSWHVPPGRPGILGPYYLWRLLIDEYHQRRGFGHAALTLAVDLIRADGATELLTSYQPGDGGPWPFYRRFGFIPTGEIDNGETVLRLDLSDPPVATVRCGSPRVGGDGRPGPGVPMPTTGLGRSCPHLAARRSLSPLCPVA